MYSSGNTYHKNFPKTPKTLPDLIPQYHPHAHSSLYHPILPLSQDSNLPHLLIQIHPNNPTIHNHPPAPMPYTQPKLTQLSQQL
ncbi:DNA gyrase subunit A, partial [Staphylococcus epidermidis]|uniref:DNA gyrase subunit A n=1 Tax=Staphylococcus epidermidis TaxID=1282 RepID=UPI0037D9F028